MSTYYYHKYNRNVRRKKVRIVGLITSLVGLLGILYVFFPLVSWQIYFAPVFASSVVTAPIPRTTVVSPDTIKSLVSNTMANFTGVDYTNAQNWFPNAKNAQVTNGNVSSYTLAIPSLGIKQAQVSTVDYDLSKHLVNYVGTAVPPNTGNAVVFGHSTLPQWFNPDNYKAIFATAYKLKAGDQIFATVSGIVYEYKIDSIIIVNPDDTSIFTQSYDDSYLTLVTCTPPGTTWKRLIIKSKLVKPL